MTKEQLLAELSRSRVSIAQDYSAVRAEFDLTAKLNRAVRRKPFAWFGAATAVGWMLAGPKTKTKTRVVTKSAPDKKGRRNEKDSTAETVAEGAAKVGIWATLFGLVRFALPYLRPYITRYATQYAMQVASRYVK